VQGILLRLEESYCTFSVGNAALHEQLRCKIWDFEFFSELGDFRQRLLSPEFPGCVHLVKLHGSGMRAFR
jgi:hypothetical protein